MEELKKIITEKTGITPEQAGKSVEEVAAYIKLRIPGVLHSQLDKILAGEDLEDSFKNKAESIGNEFKERAEGLTNDLKVAFDKAFRTKKESRPE